jgi:hypothetical protein
MCYPVATDCLYPPPQSSMNLSSNEIPEISPDDLNRKLSNITFTIGSVCKKLSKFAKNQSYEQKDSRPITETETETKFVFSDIKVSADSNSFLSGEINLSTNYKVNEENNNLFNLYLEKTKVELQDIGLENFDYISVLDNNGFFNLSLKASFPQYDSLRVTNIAGKNIELLTIDLLKLKYIVNETDILKM